MRNLTIKRTKSFVGCLAKMQIYIEDPSANELQINQIPCRKLGTLKNGEEKTFQIGDEAAKIFVIADKLSRKFCNEFFDLPAGQEDVYLTGRNKFNLLTGNAFQFDNNTSEAVLANRKRSARFGALILIPCCIAGLVGGYFIGRAIVRSAIPEEPTVKEQTFYSTGMRITLTDEFKETSAANYTAAYESKNVAVIALREPFSLMDGFENYTVTEYGQLVIKNNQLTGASIKTNGDLVYFQYDRTSPADNLHYQYYAYLYKSSGAFWMIQFATRYEDAEKYAQQITEWAKSVSFTSESSF